MSGLGLPLARVRVLDLGMNIAGPQATSLLADLGADVVKVEPPTGDTSRTLQPQTDSGVSVMLAAVNRSKRYVGLDLRRPEARPVREALLRWADVVVQNLRPGKADELGIGAEQCHEVNPHLVHVGIEAFYPADGARPGYDLLVQAETGMMHLTGNADGPPARLPGSLLDHTTGLYAALGVLAALRGDRDRTALVVSMSDVAQFLLGDRVAAHTLTGDNPHRMGSATSVVTPLAAYAAADGDLVLGAASDPLFRSLAEVLDPTMADDPRYRGQADRLEHRAELDEAIGAALATADVATWIERLTDAGVPAARVRDLPGAVERHRTLSRTGLIPVNGLPGVELVGNPLGSARTVEAPGAIGRDTRSFLLEELTVGSAAYAELERAGVVV